jgi:hypothetical protein
VPDRQPRPASNTPPPARSRRWRVVDLASAERAAQAIGLGAASLVGSVG